MTQKILLRDPRKTKVIELPSFKGSQVEFYSSLLMSDLLSFDRSGDDVQTAIKGLEKFIKSWNIYGDEAHESPLPITEENIKLLPLQDITYLFDQITALAEEQKKSSTN